MYQFMWYTPGMGESAVGPYIGTIASHQLQHRADEKDAPMAGVENTPTSTPTPPVASGPADSGLSGMITPSATGNTPHGSLDQPAPVRHSS